MTLRDSVRALVLEVQRLPFAWPGSPEAAAARASGVGSCASKHALLAEELATRGVDSQPLLVTGRLVPELLAEDPPLAAGAALREVHECLTVMTPWAGPLRVDVTWDPPLVAHGLIATLDWDGDDDMALAVENAGPGWSVPREHIRAAKEALRVRLYAPGERAVRDRVLARLATRFTAWRAASSG